MEAFHSSMQHKLHKPPHNNCLMKMIMKMRFLLASVVTAAVVPSYSFGWDNGWNDWGSGGRTPTQSPTPKRPSSNTWGSPSWWNGDNNPTDWDGWWGSGYSWEWTGDGWNWNSKQKPTSSPTSPSPSDCECEKGVSEEDCQKKKIQIEKQILQLVALQKQLEDLGVVPIGYDDDFKYLDLICVANAIAKYIAYLKLQITNHILATGDGDCKELARKNYCASICDGLIVSYGGGCRRETPQDQDITSCEDQSTFYAQVIAVTKQQLQIVGLEGQLKSFNCDIC